MDFSNRVALVTGGAGALGSAITLDLAAGGARVAVAYNVDAEWHTLSARAGAAREQLQGLRVDLTDADAVEEAVRPLGQADGHIDYLLAIAGGFAAGKIHETSAAGWDRMVDLNLKTLFSVLRPVIPIMLRQNFGRIVTVSSGAILGGPGAGIAAYAVSKAGVRHLTEVLAEEVKGYNIRVHCLLPGTMDTEANRRAMPDADPKQWVSTREVAQLVHRLLVDGEGLPLALPILRPGDSAALGKS
ncbi:MAG TPA: SDR family NAD(P)-dependent oxidoreductase [Terriglobia bacterium]|nr:SDR family NAD(P)-dependent oxidoreductase [Terriglobia bacterium]